MAENKNCIDKVIEALEAHYNKTSRNRTMEYTYGYFDALAILKELSTKNDTACKCKAV